VTTPETPAATLRRAAEAMRQHADAMQAEMTRPTYSWGTDADGTADYRYRRGVDDGLGGASGALASHWDLTTTRAVAGWLESEAERADRPGALQLAVALGYLGEAGEQVKDISDERKRPVPDWTYTDRDGDRMRLSGGNGRCVVASLSRGLIIPAEDVPKITAAMYEQAGLPAPVILGRPASRKLLVPDPHGGEEVRVTPSPGHHGDSPGVFIRVGGEDYSEIRLVDDEPLRVAIALIDAMGEAEAARPDPAEVEALAEKISAEMARRGGGTGGVYRIAAEVALRHVQDKQRERGTTS
jgi:hypothetical protein